MRFSKARSKLFLGGGLYLFYRPCMVDAMEKRYKVKTNEAVKRLRRGVACIFFIAHIWSMQWKKDTR